MFDPVGNQVDFAAMEESILEFWRHDGVFAESARQREGAPEFVFFDGPPFATGLPHYGHLLAGTIKDVVPRYQTMRGKFVDRVFGWDCHGLPVEYEMEKELGLAGKLEIEDYGIDKFNEACRGIVLRHTAEWEKVVERMGRWVDFRRGYRTMDLDYMESIWWVFKQLWDKGLIYEGHKILPYCPRCSTPLSNFEANQGYSEVEDPAITVAFRQADADNCFFLAWTTTPWTLPSNLALAVGRDIDYVKVRDGDRCFILAESRVPVYYQEPPAIVERFKGADLIGLRYEPPLPYFSIMAERGAFKIIDADYVSTEDGTGIVHTAPGFGEDDAAAAKQHGVPEVCPIDEECRFTAEVADYAGRYVKDCDKDIIRRLKESGRLIHRGSIRHSYPHCWRDDSPLIYRAVSTWFVSIDPIKEKMLDANRRIRWVPEHIKEGRFGKWLENARDWAISRNRYWGCPLPVWRDRDSGETVCVGSVAELEKLTGAAVTDIHKHFVDELEAPSSSGGVLRRVPEVLDCWFESGAMPYAQHHYPFENKDRFEANFPADFIAEGLDQTRGWFYTLVVLGAALFDAPVFKNVVVNGLILAEDGQKMSKRKKNYPDPQDIIHDYGADALRLFLLGSPVVRGEDLKFSEDGIREVLRGVMIPIWNAYSFFVTYANVDNYDPGVNGAESGPPAPVNPLDRWILSSLAQMVDEIRGEMDVYQLQRAANRFEKFVGDLTNWYIRRSRRRFWKSQNDDDKKDAYRTLHFTLITFVKTAAPFIPFVTEAIYRNLRSADMPESVHLCDFPEPESWRRDERLERQMELTMAAVSQGRHLRGQHSLKVRQPLRKAILVSVDGDVRAMLSETAAIIAEELNVKEIDIHDNEELLVERSAKANFKVLGPRLGPEMKTAAAAIANLDGAAVGRLLDGETFEIRLADGKVMAIGAEDIVVQRHERQGLFVATGDGVTIALDTMLDDGLLAEGFARELVSRIQTMRKEAGLAVSDRIKIFYRLPAARADAIKLFGDYIKTETLASSLTPGGADIPELEINGMKCGLAVEKVV